MYDYNRPLYETKLWIEWSVHTLFYFNRAIGLSSYKLSKERSELGLPEIFKDDGFQSKLDSWLW